MKTPDQLKPNYAPVYAALYPVLAAIFQRHGYALAIHGSLARDFDVIAVPWAETLSSPDAVLAEVVQRFDIRLIGDGPTQKNHGRVAYTLSIGHGECAIDLSFVNFQPQWFSGRVMCVKCSHRWVAVAPVYGDSNPAALECPACHEMSGYPTKEESQ